MRDLSIRFRAFWPGFRPDDFFVPLVEGIDPSIRVSVVEKGPVDLEFVSVFPDRRGRIVRGVSEARQHLRRGLLSAVGEDFAILDPDPEARVSVWYSGENVRPPLSDWDLTLSFDPSSGAAANEYLPLWWLLFPELLAPALASEDARLRYADLPTLSEAAQGRDSRTGDRQGFACAVIGNPEPVRMRVLRALGEIGPVDVYGRLTGRPVARKADVLSNYRFTVCFENDVFPGYVTEKLVETWACGSIPLWNGLEHSRYMNQAAIINLADERNLESFCERIAAINADAEAVSWTAAQPLLQRLPSLAETRNAIRSALVRKSVL